MSTDATLPPLVERLVAEHGASTIDTDSLERFVAQPGDRVLFFSGDPVRFPEGLDVAVVLPELQAAFPGRFEIGVVQRHCEEAVARRYGSQRWPSLVFLRNGEYVTTVAGMHDWTDYVERVGAALDMPASRAPTIGIPLVVAGSSTGASCH
jgi:hydrogenase-1 operon protein HyaE